MNYWRSWLVVGVVVVALVWFGLGDKNQDPEDRTLKVYWLIPDGLRAEPDTFTIYEWARAGLLPNLKKLMEQGSYGYSIPSFPSHTPVNYATLMTGSTPKTHKVADGPMRLEGYPLEVVSMSGFRSNAKKVPPLWYTLEERGKSAFLMSMPGSTPPELSRGVTVRGRWGGWGADFSAVNFQDEAMELPDSVEARSAKLFYFGADLHKNIKKSIAVDWSDAPTSYSAAYEVPLEGWGTMMYGYIYDSVDDGIVEYDRIALSLNKKVIVADIGVGEWTKWLPATMAWEVKNDNNIYTPKQHILEREYTALPVESFLRATLIKLEDDGAFRIRVLYDSLNEHMVRPSSVSDYFHTEIGPMVDFVDNFPPQLIYYPEDKKTFLEEAQMSFDWHQQAIPALLKEYNPEFVFHSIYTPNQMLTSRWWLGYVDPVSQRYGDVSDTEREQLWDEVLWMYQEVDTMLGEVMSNADEDTIIVFSSDHGAVPLNQEVYVNNLLAKNGLLSYTTDPVTGIAQVDWDATQAIFLRMDNVYVNPNGLGGSWQRASGVEYEALREQVISLLESVTDEDGINPFSAIVKHEQVADYLDLPEDRVGDIVIANKSGYHWSEEITPQGSIFSVPLKSGYKQAVLSSETNALWTPFVIAGPGIKSGYALQEPIYHIDQYPTIMKVINETIPDFVEGMPIREVFIEL